MKGALICTGQPPPRLGLLQVWEEGFDAVLPWTPRGGDTLIPGSSSRNGGSLGCRQGWGCPGKAVWDAIPSLHASPPVEDGPDAGAVGAVPVHVEPRGQEDPVLHGYGAVGEGGN